MLCKYWSLTTFPGFPGSRTGTEYPQRLILSLCNKLWQTCTTESLLTHTTSISSFSTGVPEVHKTTFPQKLQLSADCLLDDCKSMSCLQFMTTYELIMELNWGSNITPVLHIHSAFSPLTHHNITSYWSSDPSAEIFIPSPPHLLCISVFCLDCGKDFCPSFPQTSILQCFRTGYWRP